MDRTTDKQARIDRRRDELSARYPEIWNKLISEWNSPGPEDRAWLMYSANYLFFTRGVRWAMDPLGLKSRVPQAPALETARDLAGLDFVLLTHRHKDHLDVALLRRLRHLPIWWIVPDSLLPQVRGAAGLPADQILVAKPGLPIDLFDHRITPFDGLHWEDAPGYTEGKRGVPATGYLVEQGSRRWLFPGDTRHYDRTSLPPFEPVDVLFAHLWLGRASALKENPPLLDAFCSFHLGFQPKRIIVTHLEEHGRSANEYWDEGHFQLVRKWIWEHAPHVVVQSATHGDCVDL
jgi:hypothetical protein